MSPVGRESRPLCPAGRTAVRAVRRGWPASKGAFARQMGLYEGARYRPRSFSGGLFRVGPGREARFGAVTYRLFGKYDRQRRVSPGPPTVNARAAEPCSVARAHAEAPHRSPTPHGDGRRGAACDDALLGAALREARSLAWLPRGSFGSLRTGRHGGVRGRPASASPRADRRTAWCEVALPRVSDRYGSAARGRRRRPGAGPVHLGRWTAARGRCRGLPCAGMGSCSRTCAADATTARAP